MKLEKTWDIFDSMYYGILQKKRKEKNRMINVLMICHGRIYRA